MHPGIPAECSNLVIPGLDAANPGITGLKNCPLNANKSVIKWHFVALKMTWQFKINTCITIYSVSLGIGPMCSTILEWSSVTICHNLLSIFCLCKLVDSVNLTSAWRNNRLRRPECLTEIVDHTNMQAGKAYETCQYDGLDYVSQLYSLNLLSL